MTCWFIPNFWVENWIYQTREKGEISAMFSFMFPRGYPKMCHGQSVWCWYLVNCPCTFWQFNSLPWRITMLNRKNHLSLNGPSMPWQSVFHDRRATSPRHHLEVMSFVFPCVSLGYWVPWGQLSRSSQRHWSLLKFGNHLNPPMSKIHIYTISHKYIDLFTYLYSFMQF